MRVTTISSMLWADIKNILRDYSLSVMLIVPFIFIPLIRYGGVAIVNNFPVAHDYLPMVVMLLVSTVAVFPAYTLGFVMMDEKDGGINQMLRILPFNLGYIVGLRMATIFLVGFVNATVVMTFNGLVAFNALQVALLGVEVSLFGPIVALLMLSIAKNKIEAAAILKGLSFSSFLAFSQFFLQGSHRYLIGVLPPFWTYRAFEEMGHCSFWVYILIGIIQQAVYIYLLWKVFLRRW